jgi:hypothetical protein
VVRILHLPLGLERAGPLATDRIEQLALPRDRTVVMGREFPLGAWNMSRSCCSLVWSGSSNPSGVRDVTVT